MTDWECDQIQRKAMIHLICCAFDDFRITTLETMNELIELKKRLSE